MAFEEGSRSNHMETDDESRDSQSSSTSLRRWNSSPMINISKLSDHIIASEKARAGRTRTFSASMYSQVDPERSPHVITPIGSPASRIIQLKKEESIDEMTREVLSERNVTSEIQLSQSWGEMSLLTEKSLSFTDEKRDNNEEARSAFSSPVASPSPVRFSCEPRISRARSLTPSPGPLPISPKCRTIRRSLSPNGLRPSAFTSKRKIDPDDDDQPMLLQKRLCTQLSSTSSASTSSSPDHQSMPFDAVHLSFDDDSGSEHSLSSNATPTSISPIIVNHSNPFFYDGRSSQTFPFLKPRYVAPPSPLAAGMQSASMNNDTRKNSLHGGATYAFTPVKD
eukprot:Seg1703.5 transcript_id=Seg1703.5/GoldUCD/mRNA.D3Y31 product="Protein FAM122A" protein_id=Seg1703.5/GoldUCD/D3Y31